MSGYWYNIGAATGFFLSAVVVMLGTALGWLGWWVPAACLGATGWHLMLAVVRRLRAAPAEERTP